MASDVYQKLLKFVTFVKVPHLQKSASPLLAVPFLLDLTWDHCRFGMAQGLSRYVGMPPKIGKMIGKWWSNCQNWGVTLFLALKQSPSETQDVLIQAKRAWQRITDEALQCIQCQFQCHLLGPRWGLRWLSVSSAQALEGPRLNLTGWNMAGNSLAESCFAHLCTCVRFLGQALPL